jgi:hypothetical protein
MMTLAECNMIPMNPVVQGAVLEVNAMATPLPQSCVKRYTHHGNFMLLPLPSRCVGVLGAVALVNMAPGGLRFVFPWTCVSYDDIGRTPALD